jgi:hypothetical protein
VPRWRVACDACAASSWIGEAAGGRDAWCEACQTGARLVPGATRASCARCGAALALAEPRFVELWGEVQNASAVLAAWDGAPAALGALLPERPRFLKDRTPPAAESGDAPDVRAALLDLASGAFARARVGLEAALERAAAGPHVWRALAIAADRLDEPALAEAACTRALSATRGREDAALERAVRLERGVLRARRGHFVGAREDFAAAGDAREARWNRAALAVLEALAVTPGLPAGDVLAAARAEAGEPSAYWSDPTIGRLLFSLVAERARARSPEGRAACADERVLRAAEREFEFDTFWDRALALHAYATLGMAADAARVAAPLAAECLEIAARQPCLGAARAAEWRDALAAARRSVAAAAPRAARESLRALEADAALARFRVPCARCASGSVGVDEVAEDGDGA